MNNISEQNQIADLFLSSRTNIAEHIKHIYEEGELDESSTCRNFRQVQIEGAREVTRNILHYNLDVIIAVGYRVNSKRATAFRIWATNVLREYMGMLSFTGKQPTLKEAVLSKRYVAMEIIKKTYTTK